MKTRFIECLEDNPVIAAVKDDEGLNSCLSSDIKVVFILFGDVLTIPDIVEKVKKSGRVAMVHMDLIGGLSQKEISVDFIKSKTMADGIISTKQNLIKRAKELDLFTVMRFFVLDSMAIENLYRQCETTKPDCIEILPGLMPKIIKRVNDKVRIPIIAGGLISEREDVTAALDAGAISVSATRHEIWFM